MSPSLTDWNTNRPWSPGVGVGVGGSGRGVSVAVGVGGCGVAVGVAGTVVALGVSVAIGVGTTAVAVTVGVLLGSAGSTGCGLDTAPHPVKKRTSAASASVFPCIYLPPTKIST
jgi:hypothetical protein